jgi:hypothetical protein
VEAPPGSVVQLHNLSLHGNGGEIGILFLGSGGLDIDNVQISGFEIGIYGLAAAPAQNMVIKDTTIENVAQYGMYIQGASAANLNSVEIINTHVRYANYGIYAYYASISVLNSTFMAPNGGTTADNLGNFGTGIASDSSNIVVDHCQINGYEVGMDSTYSLSQINGSSFLDNFIAVSGNAPIVSNGSDTSFNNPDNLIVNGNSASAIRAITW